MDNPYTPEILKAFEEVKSLDNITASLREEIVGATRSGDITKALKLRDELLSIAEIRDNLRSETVKTLLNLT